MTGTAQQERRFDGDTIAAIATAPGIAGLSVLRVSGGNALSIASRVFDGAADLLSAPSHTAHHGVIRAVEGTVVDDVLLTLFRAPHSYTGEDSVEIGCHGGVVVSRAVLDCLLAAGARHAGPGEFTLRAFLNGRMDLAQAEAVADLIHSQSGAAHRASLQQLRGHVSSRVREVRERLLRCAALLELNIDFTEEDVDLLPSEKLRSELTAAVESIAEALASYGSGRIIRDGFKIVLTGRPNAGKSSLFNAMLGAKRAIVTPTPGTTRDYIEESVAYEGVLLKLVDTAGLRNPADEVEKEGISLSTEQLATADAVCCVLDAAAGECDSDTFEDISFDVRRIAGNRPVLFVFNKVDILQNTGEDDRFRIANALFTSALEGTGVQEALHAFASMGKAALAPDEGREMLVTNARHADSLHRAEIAVRSAITALEAGRGEEILAFELRAAVDALGEITGAVTSDEVLNAIFSKFCIGK